MVMIHVREAEVSCDAVALWGLTSGSDGSHWPAAAPVGPWDVLRVAPTPRRRLLRFNYRRSPSSASERASSDGIPR
jgi:hypothetical protein